MRSQGAPVDVGRRRTLFGLAALAAPAAIWQQRRRAPRVVTRPTLPATWRAGQTLTPTRTTWDQPIVRTQYVWERV